MRSLLRDASYPLFILGYAVAIVTYWYEIRRLGLNRVGELRGLLVAVRTEVLINEKILQRLIEDPYRLLYDQRPLPQTYVWERNGPRLTTLLSERILLMPEVETYFETLALLRLDMNPNATEVEIEEIIETAELCEHLGDTASKSINYRINSLEVSEQGK